jgi:hypothetical protein
MLSEKQHSFVSERSEKVLKIRYYRNNDPA